MKTHFTKLLAVSALLGSFHYALHARGQTRRSPIPAASVTATPTVSPSPYATPSVTPSPSPYASPTSGMRR